MLYFSILSTTLTSPDPDRPPNSDPQEKEEDPFRHIKIVILIYNSAEIGTFNKISVRRSLNKSAPSMI